MKHKISDKEKQQDIRMHKDDRKGSIVKGRSFFDEIEKRNVLYLVKRFQQEKESIFEMLQT